MSRLGQGSYLRGIAPETARVSGFSDPYDLGASCPILKSDRACGILSQSEAVCLGPLGPAANRIARGLRQGVGP